MFPYHVAKLRDPHGLIRFVSEKVDDGVLKTVARPVDDQETVIDYAYRFDPDVFTPDEALRWLEDNDIEFISFEEYNEPLKTDGTWDGDAAKAELFEWATDPETGELQPDKLKPYFGKVTGSGKKRGDYSFPLARVVDGEPEYDRDGLIAAFTAARGAHGWGTSPTVVKKVVSIFKKIFGEDELTNGMKKFVQKQDVNYCHNPPGPGGGQFCSSEGLGISSGDIRGSYTPLSYPRRGKKVSKEALETNRWNGSVAKKTLFKWGKDPETGELDQKKLKKYFLKVEGDGTKQSDYKYPVAQVRKGKPYYDQKGLLSTFKAAMGGRSGKVDIEAAQKAAKLYKKHFGSERLTPGMKALLKMGKKKHNAAFSFEEISWIQKLDEDISPDGPAWDEESAKEGLIDWARDSDGTIRKKFLMKWFLDIDGGDGQDPKSYRYPVGKVSPFGEPDYDPAGIDHAWDLASGKKTGVANRAIQRKVVYLKKKLGIPLTPEQLEFMQRHMAAGKTIKTYRNDMRTASVFKSGDDFYVDINDGELKLNAVDESAAHYMAHEYVRSGNVLNDCVKFDEGIVSDPNSPGGMRVLDGNVKHNTVRRSGSKVLRETDEFIEIPVIPMREGVFTGTDGIPTFKPYEVIKRDAHWLEGQPILRGHTLPTEIVTYKHNRIGKLLNVRPRDDKRDVIAVARYFKSKITPEELERIRSGMPYDGSIAYTCNTVMREGVFSGEKYNAVETDGYHFYHFAEVPKGACSVDKGCGFNLNAKYNDEEDDYDEDYDDEDYDDEDYDDEDEFEDEDELVTDEDGNECYMSELVDGMCPVDEEDEEDEEDEFEDEDESEDEDDVKENSRVVVDVRIPEEFVQKLNEVIDELTEVQAKLNSLGEIRQNAATQDDFEAFRMQLNAAARKDAEEHYAGFRVYGWNYFAQNPGILKASVGHQKMMGTPVARTSEYYDELARAKEELKKTLRTKQVR